MNVKVAAAILPFIDRGLASPAENVPLLQDLRAELGAALSRAGRLGLARRMAAGGGDAASASPAQARRRAWLDLGDQMRPARQAGGRPSPPGPQRCRTFSRGLQYERSRHSSRAGSPACATLPLHPLERHMAPRITEEDVLGALRPIVDPDFGKSIVDLGFVKNVRIDGWARGVHDRADDARLPGEGRVREGGAGARLGSSRRRDRRSVDDGEHPGPRRPCPLHRRARSSPGSATRSRWPRARAASARARPP